MNADALGFDSLNCELKKIPGEQTSRDLDMAELRRRVIALQQSAANLAQLDLTTLAKLLPPNMAPQQVFHIKNKLLQLNNLQHRKAERSLSVNDASDVADNRCSSRYKTELCRPYEENGSCKYGSRCQFAHGSDELRTMTRHPKYKSQLCRTFHSNGLCPYGHRCHFIHNKDELNVSSSPNRSPSVDLNNNSLMGYNSSSSLSDFFAVRGRHASVTGVTNPQHNILNHQSLHRSSSVDTSVFTRAVGARSASVSSFPQSLSTFGVRRPVVNATNGPTNAATFAKSSCKDIPSVPRPQFYSLACSVSSSDGLSPPMSPSQAFFEDPFSPLGSNKNNHHFFGGSSNVIDYNLQTIASSDSGDNSPSSMATSPVDKLYAQSLYNLDVWNPKV